MIRFSSVRSAAILICVLAIVSAGMAQQNSAAKPRARDLINAMIAAETMTGIENHRVIALPHEKLHEVLKKYNRLVQ